MRTWEPGEGVELLRAWFGGRAFTKHRHDTYAIGVTEAGVQTFFYRGRVERSTPGQVVVLHPDEVHDGRAGTEAGFGYGYRIVEVVTGLSRYELARQFRVAYGTSPYRYSLMRRCKAFFKRERLV